MTADFNKLLDDTFEKLMKTNIANDGSAVSTAAELPSSIKKIPLLEDQGDDSLLKECDAGLTSEAIEAVMDVLISKDVLLEPLQSLDKSYDDWAVESLSLETTERQEAVEKQRRLIKDIINLFNESEDVTGEVKKDIFEKMQAIQELGMPPEAVAAKISDGADETIFPGNCSIM